MYHGWIVDDRAGGGTDEVFVEFMEDGERKRITMGHGESGALAAVAWWDKRIGSPVKLLNIPGGYRVFTGEM